MVNSCILHIKVLEEIVSIFVMQSRCSIPRWDVRLQKHLLPWCAIAPPQCAG